jgi:two-component system CheB/CheR fusion protein
MLNQGLGPVVDERDRAVLHARTPADVGACLRADLSADETFYQVACLLGRLPGVSRATFGTVDPAAQTITIHRDFCRGVASMSGMYRMSDTEQTCRELARGEVVVIADISTDYRTRDDIALRIKRGYYACVAIPLMRGDVWSATLMVQSTAPRVWEVDEVELIRTAAERTWLAVENVRLLREARNANAAKDRFLAVLSHELRTPLTPVLMTLGMLAESAELSAKVKADLAVIRRNIDLETQLIDDLLDVTRIMNGKLRLSLRPVRMHELLRHVCQICAGDVEGRRAQLICELNARCDETEADAARLEQVFWNLVKNAIKFSADGSTVRLSTSDVDGEFLLKVEDQGVGISPEVLPRIFDAFEQGEQSVTRTFGGLGLGLAISKAVVDLHGGRIWATSDGPGKGTTLHVAMPLKSADRRMVNDRSPARKLPADGVRVPAADDANRPEQVFKANGVRALLVDDHKDTLMLTKRLLAGAGMSVTGTQNMREALEAPRRDTFDLLISDIGLPDGTGYDLVEQVLRLQPLKAIALSGFGMEADVRRSLNAGFHAHLTKPVSIDRLEETIARVLRE